MTTITAPIARQRSGQLALGALKLGLAGCALALVGTLGLVACKIMGFAVL